MGFNIYNVEDLINLTEDDLLSIRNFGKKSFDEVLDFIKPFGLKLRAKFETLKKDYSDKFEILSTKILNTPLSIRTKNCLITLNIKDIGEDNSIWRERVIKDKKFWKKIIKGIKKFFSEI